MPEMGIRFPHAILSNLHCFCTGVRLQSSRTRQLSEERVKLGIMHSTREVESMRIYTKSIDGVWFGVACENEEVFATSFASSEENILKSLRNSLPSNSTWERPSRASRFAERAFNALKRVYDGEDAGYSVPLNFDHLSSYMRKVIEAVCRIPIGYVSSYGSVAETVGGTPRAVGHAMASNPYAPLCPCHRVVGSDFSLCGYGGGLKAKLAFLKRERRGFSTERRIAIGNGKLEVFPVERVLEKARKGKR